MNQPLSQEFVVSFITTCFDAGLSKEAAAELLQKETVDLECAARPEFAEGYKKAAAEFPGELQPIFLGYGGMEKAAKGNLVRMARGLWDVFAGSTGAVRSGIKSLGTGVEHVSKSPFLKQHPFGSAVGSAAVAGVGGWAANQYLNRDRGLLSGGASDPFFAPGSYSPERYQERYEDQLQEGYAPGIYEHNKEYFGTEARRQELKKAIEEGQDWNGDAYRELQELNREHSSASAARRDYLENLSAHGSNSREKLNRIRERQAQLESQRDSVWGLPKRMWLSMTGRDPEEHFDSRIGRLHSAAGQAKMQADLATDRQRLMRTGATTPPEETGSPGDNTLQDRFFSKFE